MLRFGEKEIAKETFYTAKRNVKIYDVNVSSGKRNNIFFLPQRNNIFFKKIYNNKIFKLMKNFIFFSYFKVWSIKEILLPKDP